jgi:hypothetical protein
MDKPSDEGADVLHGIWSATRTSHEELADEFGDGRSCKTTRHLGFSGYADRERENSAGVDKNLRAAWRETLDREGKRTDGADALHEVEQ